MSDKTIGLDRLPFSVRALLVSLALLLASGIASLAGNRFILSEFPDRPRPRDALFELLPYVSWARYLTAVALVAAFALFFVFAVRRMAADIPRFIAIFAIMYLFRAAIMVLTPLANAHGEGPFLFALTQYGMFPSGHTAAAVLLALFTDAAIAPGLRRVQVALAWTLAASFVLAHGHYSIDVVGGFLLAYFVEREWSNGSLFNPAKRAMFGGATSSRREDRPTPDSA